MPGVRMSAPKGRVRIDRQRGNPAGYAHHAEEQRLPPPGHEERIAAHRERVAREEAEWQARHEAAVERSRDQPIERRPREAPEPPLTPLRRRVVCFLAAATGPVERPQIGVLLGVGRARLDSLVRHPWFAAQRRRGGRRDRRRLGGGSLPSLVTLTPEGRAEAQRLVREGGAS